MLIVLLLLRGIHLDSSICILCSDFDENGAEDGVGSDVEQEIYSNLFFTHQAEAPKEQKKPKEEKKKKKETKKKETKLRQKGKKEEEEKEEEEEDRSKTLQTGKSRLSEDVMGIRSDEDGESDEIESRGLHRGGHGGSKKGEDEEESRSARFNRNGAAAKTGGSNRSASGGMLHLPGSDSDSDSSPVVSTLDLSGRRQKVEKRGEVPVRPKSAPIVMTFGDSEDESSEEEYAVREIGKKRAQSEAPVELPDPNLVSIVTGGVSFFFWFWCSLLQLFVTCRGRPCGTMLRGRNLESAGIVIRRGTTPLTVRRSGPAICASRSDTQ